MSIPLSGTIRTKPLSAILEHLRRRTATGVLTLRAGDVAKSIYVKDGKIVFATSTEPHDRLGEVLVKSGKITRDNLEQALRVYQKSAGLKKLGAILVEQGFLPPKDLFGGLKMQVKEIILSLFLWSSGEYRFEESLPPDIIQLNIDIEELISETIERIKLEA
ncbi:MAG TPA: DUF4388 domain-containing protein [Nitrospirota bacterium]